MRVGPSRRFRPSPEEIAPWLRTFTFTAGMLDQIVTRW